MGKSVSTFLMQGMMTFLFVEKVENVLFPPKTRGVTAIVFVRFIIDGFSHIPEFSLRLYGRIIPSKSKWYGVFSLNNLHFTLLLLFAINMNLPPLLYLLGELFQEA